MYLFIRITYYCNEYLDLIARASWAQNVSEGPNPKIYAPKIQIFTFYCIFSLQFFKVSEGPGPHGPHTHEALDFYIHFQSHKQSIDERRSKSGARERRSFSCERERERRSRTERWARAGAPLSRWDVSASASAAHHFSSKNCLKFDFKRQFCLKCNKIYC